MKKELIRRVGSFLLAAAVATALAAPAAAASEHHLPLDGGGVVLAAGQLTDFSVKLPAATQLSLGTPEKLAAAVTPIPGDVVLAPGDVKWMWSCEPKDALEIKPDAQDGAAAVLVPKRAGEVTVKASATVETQDGQRITREATCLISVRYADASSVAIVPNNIELEPKGERTLMATVSPSTADQSKVLWSVDDGEIVKLSAASGSTVVVTGGKAGQTTITASSGDGSPGVCTVNVKGVVLSEDELSIPVGSSKQLAATPHGDIGTYVEWSSGNDSIAFVSPTGEITAQSVGKTTVTATINGYSAKCEVTVVENTANTISESVDANRPFDFSDIRSELNERSETVLGEPLSYITNLMVSTKEGILYYGYVSPDDTGYGVGSTERYYYRDSLPGERSLSELTFVSKPEFNGKASIRYTGYSDSNKSFTGYIKLDVEGTPDVTYTTSSKTPVQLQASDFSSICRKRTGRDVSYVTFEQPTSNRGTLYYNYSGEGIYSEKVASSTQYHRNRNPYLDQVFFVPEEGYTGTVRMNYRCVDTAGNSFGGQVTVIVSNSTNLEKGEVTYRARQGALIRFDGDDFNRACRDINGVNLNYVRFKLPDSSKGTLYFRYRMGSSSEYVSSSTRYYHKGNSPISDITFVPKSGYTGNVWIDFMGYDVDGEPFDGRVSIHISDQEVSHGEIRYSTRGRNPVTFAAADFNELCQNQNGSSLDYVRFELPSSRQGTLYYNYTDSSYNNEVSENTKYYHKGSPSLSKVTFVPNGRYSGIVSIDFSGYDKSGARLRGTVEITVDGAQEQDITYSVATGGAVEFRPSDFDRVCRDMTGRDLDYVRFELPSSSKGTLYYRYDQENDRYSSKVSESHHYYYDSGSRQLGDVTFVPHQNYKGEVRIEVTGWSTRGDKFSTTVIVEVRDPVASSIQYLGSATPIQLQSSNFRAVCNSLLGRELSHIQFGRIPDARAGRLYLSYVSPTQIGTPVSAGTSYYYNRAPGLGQISFVPRAGFQGTVSVPYTGYDANGTRFDGTVEFVISNGMSVSWFTDMDSYRWANPAVDFLFQNGIVGGVSQTEFGPAQSVRRGDFVLMLCKALNLRTGSTPGFTDVPANSYYGWAVATAEDLGVAYGNDKGQFMPNQAVTRQDAMVMIKKAMLAAGKNVPTGNTELLNSYVDGGQAASYARESVAALIQLGAVSGDNTRHLNPHSAIRRAEMAVILHNVLTY